MVCSEKLRRWSSSSIIFRRWVTGTPPVTHTYIKPSSNQRSTTARVASAAGRLRSSRLFGMCVWPDSQLPKMPFLRTYPVWIDRDHFAPPSTYAFKLTRQVGLKSSHAGEAFHRLFIFLTSPYHSEVVRMLCHLQWAGSDTICVPQLRTEKRTHDKKGASMRTFLFGLAVTLALAVGMPAAQAQDQDNNAREQDGVPQLDHVFVIVLENHNSFTSFGSIGILDNPQAPKITALAQKYNVAPNYHGVWHPSLPNYLAMITGDWIGTDVS